MTTADIAVPNPGAVVTSVPDADVPRRISTRTHDDVFSLIGAAGGSFALVWLVFTRILDLSGTVGFLVCWYLVFLAMYAGLSALSNPAVIVKAKIAATFIHAGALIAAAGLVTAVVFTFIKGRAALAHSNFFTHDMAGVGPRDPLNRGGVLHAIVGSLIEVGIAVAVALPLGLATAVYMTEVGGRGSRFVRTIIEAMTALPSIVAGLFIYTVLIVGLHLSPTGFTAAMALSVMMLPIIARSAEVTLRVVPGGLREAGLALGSSHWQSVWRIVLPTARSGLATALILGVARSIGETSPVLLTSGASTYLNTNPTQDPMNSLPLFVFSAVRSGETLFISRGFGAAAILMILVLVLFVITRVLARPRKGQSMNKRVIRNLVPALVVAAGLSLAAAAPASAGDSHALIQGSGSSWSANAVNQWIADVQSSGLQVVYTASGSAQGRKDFGYRTNDFAVSDIGYQGTDPLTGQADNSNGRAYAYLPIVAGGTAFPYQIRVAGKLVRNLRLSGETLAKIFTNKITNWDDPEITADNNGRRLPSIPIIPVVHSEGAGTSAMFTEYLDTEYPSIWRPYLGASGMTEYYPRKGNMIAQNGSDGVMNFVTQASANGAIGMDEYSYALADNYPVVKLENADGYFTLPTQYNVAVALTQALINENKSSPNYLLQTLNKVYVYGDPRTYPLSSYSYMIIPTSPTDPRMTTAKRQTLADFLYYSICQGQKEMGPIGYSPLPINLVTAGFAQTALLKAADPGVDLTQRDVATCDNPTFIAGQPTRNYLAEIAPYPPTCDKAGQGPCTGAGDPGTRNPPASGSKTVAAGSGTKASTSDAAAKSSTAAKASASATGPPTDQSTTTGTSSEAAAAPYPVDLAAAHADNPTGWEGLVCVLLLAAALIIPPTLSRYLDRRKAAKT